MSEAIIRPATVADAPYMTQCHIECLAETYAHIMPPAFAQQRRDRFRAEVDELVVQLVEAEQAEAADRQPVRRHWLAELDGEVVGVAASGPGVAPWELEYFSNPEPPVGFNLDHLYTRARTHGSGLGPRMLATALARPGSDEPLAAWLWIMRENPRAEAFYRRHGFVDDDLDGRLPGALEVDCGPTWFHRPMFRMWRPGADT
ncbi:hypothetical protein GCM10027030_30590 [Luteococcus sediminum]